MLRGQKLFLAIWLSLIFSLLLQNWLGPYGPEAQALLRTYHQKLDKRLEELRQENLKLNNHYQALQESEEEVKLQARRLGYFDRGEIPIKVLDDSFFEQEWTIGNMSVVSPLNSKVDLDVFFRMAWLVSFLFFYFILYFIDRFGVRTVVPRLSLPVSDKKQVTNDLEFRLPVIRQYRDYGL